MRLSIMHYGKRSYPNHNDVVAPRFLKLLLYDEKVKKIRDRCFFCNWYINMPSCEIRLIQGYNIENAQGWQIYNKGQF